MMSDGALRASVLVGVSSQNHGCPEDIEDAVQFAFLQRAQQLKDVPRRWLVVVAERELWRLQRRRRDVAADEPVDHGRDDPRLEFVGEVSALRQLKPAHARTLMLKACGFSYQEIAAIDGRTYTHVNRCMFEGRSALRTEPRVFVQDQEQENGHG